MPESFSAFCRTVSLTAANTSRIFDVSVACVKLPVVVSIEVRENRNEERTEGKSITWLC
jgi:hypothetical protein